MAKRCMISGKGPKFGNTRSHSMKATSRKFKPNIIKKKIKLGDGNVVTLNISARYYKKLSSQGLI